MYCSLRKGKVNMERISFISDIHTNIPALKAVLLDIKNRGISRIMCLGDLAGKGASPQTAVVPLKVSQASYGIIEGVYGSREESSISISLVRVPYDVNRAIKEAKDVEVPDFEKYSHELRTGVTFRVD